MPSLKVVSPKLTGGRLTGPALMVIDPASMAKDAKNEMRFFIVPRLISLAGC